MTPSRASKESVLVVPMPERAAIVLRGKDRTSWLNGMVTCDVTAVTPGHAAYGFLVEKKGRIQTDFFLVAGDAHLALFVPAERREGVYATLDHHLIMEDVELATPELAVFAVVGPKTDELSRKVGAAFAGAGLDLLATGGGAILADAPDARVGEKLASAASDLGGAVGDEATWRALCVERGLPRFGDEFDTTFYPQEASLEKLAVSFSKGCYLGQEVVYMLENRGHVKRKLVPLDIEGEGAVAVGAPVTTPEGEGVGDVKSSTVGPTRNVPVAIAIVKWAHAKPGAELRVDGRVARVRAFP